MPVLHIGMDGKAALSGTLWSLLRFPEAWRSGNSPKSSPRSWSSVRFSETMRTEEVESA